MVHRVCVVGAGVIGLSTAYNILASVPDVEVTIVADRFSPDTTGDGTAGLWLPYLAADTPIELIRKWGKDTWDYLVKILRSPEADAAGVSLKSGSILFDKKPEEPCWTDIVFDLKPFSQSELDTLFPGHEYGLHMTVVFCMCLRYLPWLMQRYEAIGGKIRKMTLTSLSEIADEYDIIVACPGVRARHLLNDDQVFPIRGQIVTVKSLWMNFAIVFKGASPPTYLLPGTEFLHCGGTAKVDDWNETSDPVDVQGIIERCTKLVPSLKSAKVVSTWAGLRPGRSRVRLEREDKVIGGTMKKVVYNYGHGGSGVTLHWGCALEATELVQQCIQELQLSCSKL